MTESAQERFHRVAAAFTARVAAVPEDAWSRPAPCDGWLARDVVRHLVEWVPGFLEAFTGSGLPGAAPAVDDEPVAAWTWLRDRLGALLADPDAARREVQGPAGPTTVASLVDRFVTTDVFVHTWDLARATGLDEHLDADEAARLLDGMAPLDEMLRASGHFGPRVVVSDDAPVQDRLLAFLGRRP